MLKLMLLGLLLLGAYGLAVVLLRRLTETTRRLGELQEQMARNDARLAEQMREVARRRDEENKPQMNTDEHR